MNAENLKPQQPIRLGRLLESSDAFILESEINRLADRLALVYPQLPDAAKADVIILGHSLSRLRHKLKALEEKQAMKKGLPFLKHRKAA